jgi:hypothetical protein
MRSRAARTESAPVLAMLKEVVGLKQVLFGTDHPYLRRDIAIRSVRNMREALALSAPEQEAAVPSPSRAASRQVNASVICLSRAMRTRPNSCLRAIPHCSGIQQGPFVLFDVVGSPVGAQSKAGGTEAGGTAATAVRMWESLEDARLNFRRRAWGSRVSAARRT